MGGFLVGLLPFDKLGKQTNQKTGYSGLRYRFSRFPRFAQSSGRLRRPYYPCHILNSKKTFSKLQICLRSILKYKNSFLLFILFLSLIFFSCKPRKITNSDKINIVCSFFPIYDWTNSIIGGLENETSLTMLEKSGIDYHKYVPSQIDFQIITQSDLIILNGGSSENWIFEILKNHENHAKVLNLSEVLQNQNRLIQNDDSFDEHTWLSIKNAIICSNSIYEILCEIVPSNRQKYSDNFSLYREQLENLDSTFSSLVSSSDSKVLLFADRFPFAYFAKDYSLECYSLSDNCSENFYVTQKQIDFLAQKLNTTNLNALIILDQSTKDYARKVILQAEKPRCDIFEMDSLQTSSLRNAFNDKTYIYAMQKNLETITKCLISK